MRLDLRTINENRLHEMGRNINDVSKGITSTIEKWAKDDEKLNAYTHLFMDTQFNIQNAEYVSVP